MHTAVMRRALRRATAQIRYVRPVSPGAATSLVRAVYAQVERDFGMLAPPVALHSAAPGPLAASWAMLRESLVVPGLAGRAAKETVAAAVSLGNACPYCVAVHGAVLGGLDHRDDAEAIGGDRLDSMADSSLRDLAAWARSSGLREPTQRGDLPFPGEQLPEIAGVVVTFQYLNRMVTVFCEDSPLPGVLPAPVAGGMLRVLGKFLRSTALGALEPGASLGLLPGAGLGGRPPIPPRDAPSPGDLGWAAGNQVIADAFGRATAAIEVAGAHAASQQVRDLVTSELAAWSGQPAGLGRSWADDALSRLSQADQPAGRLALLITFAPHQVMAADIEDYRADLRSDEDVIGLAAWASLAAARRVGSWLAPARGDLRR
jgi:AhpD family alkylhydroperoxidase